MADIDDVKGRIKEATGDLTGDDDLKHEGQTDRAAARVKDTIEDVKEAAEGAVDALKDKVHDITRRDSTHSD